MSELVLLVKTTIVLAAALMAVAAGRQAAAAVRALILTAAFGIVLGIPFAQWLMPERVLEVGLPVRQSTPVSSARQGTDPVPSPAVSDTTRAPVAVATAPAVTMDVIVPIIWLAGASVVALRLALAFQRLRRLRQTGTVWHDGTVAAVVRSTTRPVSVFLHAELAAPMTCGILRPAIGLPVDAPGWAPRDLRRALIHEIEHVRRGDWLVQVLARIACTVYWFHPLIWIAERRLNLEMEHACDDAVVRTSEGTAYAEQLLTMARRLRGLTSSVGLGMAGRRDLTKRVDAVLNPLRSRASVRRASVGLTVATAALLAGAMAPWQLASAQGVEEVRPIPTALTGNRFESVAIRAGERDGSLAVSFDRGTGRFLARNVSLLGLVSQAYAPVATPDFMSGDPYELHDTHIMGGPDWMAHDRFVVEASAPASAAPAEIREMLRQLLYDSFDLFVRVERQETTAYRLMRARDDASLGPGLTPADRSCAQRWDTEGGGPGHIVRRCTTLAALAADFTLAEALDGPVVDRTGVTGFFDVSVRYAPTDAELATIYGTTASQMPREMMTRSRIFAAFEQQLGLKLERTRGAIYRLAIDYARRPTLTQ
jgi:uncharacterized protein (TIGR03435 family)